MFCRQSERQYLRPERLADVMALIQVLALDKDSHRSEEGLLVELQGSPKSATSWRDLALEHPEFFRVKKEGLHGVALVARHVLPINEDKREPLSPEFTGHLLNSAIELHDRQIRRNDRWTYQIPIWAAFIAGIFSLVAVLARESCGGKASSNSGQQASPSSAAPAPPQAIIGPAGEQLRYTFQVLEEHLGEQHIYRLNQDTGEILRINVVRKKDGSGFTPDFMVVTPSKP
jgi:hypothetical protein